MLILNTWSFQKKMFFNLTGVLVYSLTKMCCWRLFWKFCKTCRNISMKEFTVKKGTVFRVPTFWTKRSAKYNFSRISVIFNITNITYLDYQTWFQYGIISFDYSNLDIDNYSFSSSHRIVVGKNVRQQLNKLVCKYYLTVHCFYAGVQSPTCATCGKYLREGIMATVTPKLGIDVKGTESSTKKGRPCFGASRIEKGTQLHNQDDNSRMPAGKQGTAAI